MWKLIFILIISFSVTLQGQDKEYNFPKLKSYKTDRIQLESNLPDDFSKLFLEYAEGFSILIYEFLADIKGESSNINIHIQIFNSCGDFSRYLSSISIPSKGSLYFREIKSNSWTEFSIAGCYSNSNFFFRSFQHRLVESMLKDKKKQLPVWLTQGMEEYFENSFFLEEDESITPSLKFDYFRRLKKIQSEKLSSDSELQVLLTLEKREWFKRSKFYYPYNWAFFKYLFDINSNGRNILKKYINNLEYNDKGINLLKSYNNVFSFMGARDTISIKELEKGFNDWLKQLPLPVGYNYFTSLQNANVSSSRIKLMEVAISENKKYHLYYQKLAEEYYLLSNFHKSLEYAEQAVDLEIKDGVSVQLAIKSSFQIGLYRKTEYYLWLAKELNIEQTSFKDILQSVINWRISNQEVPLFVPEVKFPVLY